MKLTQKSKFKGHSHFFTPHHYSHRNEHPQTRHNGYLDMLISSLWPKNSSECGKKCRKQSLKKWVNALI